MQCVLHSDLVLIAHMYRSRVLSIAVHSFGRKLQLLDVVETGNMKLLIRNFCRCYESI